MNPMTRVARCVTIEGVRKIPALHFQPAERDEARLGRDVLSALTSKTPAGLGLCHAMWLNRPRAAVSTECGCELELNELAR